MGGVTLLIGLQSDGTMSPKFTKFVPGIKNLHSFMSLFMAISLNKLICSDLNFTALNAGTETEDDQIKQKIKQSVILYVERNTNIAICCWEKKNR